MAAIPPYQAQRAGVLGDPGAIDTSASINALLGAHPSTTVYTGSEILTPTGSGGAPLSVNLGAADWDQPFTMSGTAIGRVVIPVAPVGTGADLTVSLCNDSSGSPGSVIVSTRIAAKVLGALVATATLAAGSAPPLATAANNSITGGPGQFVTYAAPAVSIQGGGATAGSVTVGNNILLVGGQDQSSSNNPVANVFSIAYTGGTTLAAPVPQPSLPEALAYPGVAATPDTLVVASGLVPGTSATPTASVFTASLNTATGAVGAWSTQTSLPQALMQATVVASGETVYVIGGLTAGLVGTNTVYWATVQNGQISAWNVGTPFPTATNVAASAAAVVNGFLVVTNQVGSNNFDVVYAPINADGSIGAWQTGPSVPYHVGMQMAAIAGVGVVIQAESGPTEYLQTLTVGPTGPGASVQLQINGDLSATQGQGPMAVMPSGNGWQLFCLYSTEYYTQTISVQPAVSVALPASGLTNGGTYHVVLSQQGGDAADYLLASTDTAVFPGNPTAKSRARFGGSGWTAISPAGTAIPIQLYDQSARGQPLHTWVDSGARHSSLIYTTTPDRRLLGVIEQTAQPGPVLNAAPTFVGGLGPWTVAGGTGTTSAAQVHGQLPLSAQITPSGSATTAGIESEQQPVYQGHTYVASAWAYSAVGYANATVNIRWYNAGGLQATTTGTVTALPAGVWTRLTVSGAVPAGALYATVQVIEGGTPAATAIFWVSAAPLQDASGPMLPSIAQIQYPGSWPGQLWPPLGIAQLA